MTSEESGQMDVLGWIKQQFKDKKTGVVLKNKRFEIYSPDGNTTIEGSTDEEGYVDIKNWGFSKYFVYFPEDKK